MSRRIRVTPVDRDAIEVRSAGAKIEVRPVVDLGEEVDGLSDLDPLPPAPDPDPGTSDLAARADHVHPEQTNSGELADLDDVDVATDPPAQDDVLAWDVALQKWTPATLSSTAGGPGGGAVDTVDGRTGDVTLADLYEPIGAAAALAGTLGSAAYTSSSAYATAAQGAKADTAVQPAALVAYELISSKDQANGYAGLSPLGKIANSALPALSITDTFTAASEVAMLTLSAEQGDVAVRSDLMRTFILAGSNPAILGNWVQLPTPTDTVLSVNGFTGVVVLGYSDVGAASAAQGALAVTAVQPGDLGTAAYAALSSLATAAQGSKADTAVQPGSLGTAAYENSTAFATAAQGTKADTAVQPGSLGSAAYQSSVAFASAAQGSLADSAAQQVDLDAIPRPLIEADWSVKTFPTGGAVPAAELSPASNLAGWEAAGGPALWNVPTTEGPQRILHINAIDSTVDGVYVYTPGTPSTFTRSSDANTTAKLDGALISAKLYRRHTDNEPVDAPPYYMTNLVHLWAVDPSDAIGTAEWEYTLFTDLQTTQDYIGYVLGLIGSGGGLQTVRAATTGNITLSGEQTIDGVAVVAGDDVLVKSQSTAAENSVYTVASGAWAAASWDTADVTMVVREGTVNGGKIFTNASNISPLSQGITASQVTSGELDVARIPSLPASKLTSGTFELDRIAWNGGMLGFAPAPSTLYPAAGGVQPLAETIPSVVGTTITNTTSSLVSGRLQLTGIVLFKGMQITHIAHIAGATSLATATHQWFGIWADNYECLAVTNNDTNTAWNSLTVKVLALAGGSTYTVPYTGKYYVGINVTATTVPTLRGVSMHSTYNRVRSLIADTGLTTPPAVGSFATPTTMHSFGNLGVLPYAWVGGAA